MGADAAVSVGVSMYLPETAVASPRSKCSVPRARPLSVLAGMREPDSVVRHGEACGIGSGVGDSGRQREGFAVLSGSLI